MWLFEVHDDIRPGFKLTLNAGEVGVPMGFDDAIKTTAWLPVGTSIERALRHPEDQKQSFSLLRAKLEDTTIGLCLVSQTEEEARAEKLALVLVHAITNPELGVTRIAEAHNKPSPELVTFTQGEEHLRNLYVFRPGDALFISWAARALGTDHHKRFIVAWDGEQLKELAVSRPRRNSRPPKRVRAQEQRTHQHPAASPKELRP